MLLATLHPGQEVESAGLGRFSDGLSLGRRSRDPFGDSPNDVGFQVSIADRPDGDMRRTSLASAADQREESYRCATRCDLRWRDRLRPVDDQYHIDAVLRDYQSTRDLVAQYQTHDESLRYVVAQYDRLKKSNSLLGSWFGLPNQEEAINAQSVEDLKSLLNNFHAVATPFGEGLAIKLGVNMYRIIFAVPMRITPTISVGDLPAGVKMQVIESSNLGATILYTPLSQPMNIFGRPTNGN